MKKVLYLISLVIFFTPLRPTVPFEEMNEYDQASEFRNRADKEWVRKKYMVEYLQIRIKYRQNNGLEINNDLKERLANAEADFEEARNKCNNAQLNEIWARDNGLSLSHLFQYGINNSKRIAIAGLASAIGLIYYFL